MLARKKAMELQNSLLSLEMRLESLVNECKDFVIIDEVSYELCALLIEDLADINREHARTVAHLEPTEEVLRNSCEFRSSIKKLSSRLQASVKGFDRLRPAPINVPDPSIASGDSMTHHTFSPQFKLPEYDLPTFNGEYHKWVRFSDTFSSMIIKNPSISESMKLYYLEHALKGEAKTCLLSLPQDSADFNSAWSLLESRYNNPRIIATNHIRAIFNASIVDGTAGSIRMLSDTFTANVNALKNLSKGASLENLFLVHLLLSKIDATVTPEEQVRIRDS